ncbi:MAG TPA: xylulokinase [Thermomicrobiales bacterium]|nr:xylulokinase [Thermomicrobiales bacterium]
MTPVVLGIDSGTQSVKALVVDLGSGVTISDGRADHHGVTTQDPSMWWDALVIAVRQAIAAAPDDVEVRGISVDAQQHGLVALDADGRPVMPAPLWNNTDSAPDAERLNGLADFAAETGTRLVPSITITKLAQLARTRPDLLDRTDAICLPHDYLNLRLTGRLVTDRGEASGSGWWSSVSETQRRDLLALATGQHHAERLSLPDVAGPDEIVGELSPDAAEALGLRPGIPVGPGSGDNSAAAAGIGAAPGELVISLGTSGVAFTVASKTTTDSSGEVCGFADATGRYLPLACMLNCTRVFDVTARTVGLDRNDALRLASGMSPGADGLTLVPYFGGERTPNIPQATGQIVGLTDANATPAHFARAALDGVAAGIAYCVDALGRDGFRADGATLVGGGAASPVWQQAVADALGLPVAVRSGSEHAARGMAAQAAAIATGGSTFDRTQAWRPPVVATAEPHADRAAFRLDERRQMIAALKG